MAYPKAVIERPEKLASDLVWGVNGDNGIAAELGISTRHAYYLVAKGIIPARKLGPRTIVASRSALRAWLANTAITDRSEVGDDA
jgi:hypothetical protein